MKRIAAVVIVAGIGIAGMTEVSAQGQGAQTNCDGTGACKVDVSVTNCFISPNVWSLPVRGKNIDIFWELDSGSAGSYRFNDGDGIKLKQNDPEFDQPESQANGKKFKLHDKNSKAKPGEKISYPYNIKVQRLFLGNWFDCPPLDPIIVNEG